PAPEAVQWFGERPMSRAECAAGRVDDASDLAVWSPRPSRLGAAEGKGKGHGPMNARVLVTALVVLLADVGTKRLIARRLGEGEARRLAGLLEVRRGTRRRLAFGDRGGRWLPLFAWIAIALLIAFQGAYTSLWRHPLAQVGLGAALGGALGNLW